MQMPPGMPKPRPIPDVKHVVAVSSGKGGVGKTTVSVNLSVALARHGQDVGLLDADIYGPNVPMMLGAAEQPRAVGGKIIPLENHGVKLMSLGLIAGEDTPVIWRGPIVGKMIQQFMSDVAWGALDFLVVDLPPGTGDAQLTLAQTVPLSGAVIVTTPQDVALEDVTRSVEMFRKVDVPILGAVENMSAFTCPCCGESVAIFGAGGGDRIAQAFNVPLLGRLPILPAIRKGGDAGDPIAAGESDETRTFLEIARMIMDQIDAHEQPGPKITIS